MVKSKKLSKSSLAVIIMSLLLILSMIVGMTAAWFTDKDSENADTTIKFGTVNIDLTTTTTGAWSSESTVVSELMPGDSYSATIQLKNVGSQGVYYKVTTTAKFFAKNDASKSNPLTIQGIELGIDKSAVGAEAASGIYSLAANAKVDFPVSMTLSNQLDNTYQGAEYVVVFNVSVEAVQQANFTPGTDAWPTVQQVA